MSTLDRPTTTKMTPDEVVERLERIRAKIRADNPKVTEAEWDELADRLAEEVKERLAARVRRSRGEL